MHTVQVRYTELMTPNIACFLLELLSCLSLHGKKSHSQALSFFFISKLTANCLDSAVRRRLPGTACGISFLIFRRVPLTQERFWVAVGNLVTSHL